MSVSITTTMTINTNGPPHGCDVVAGSTTNRGLNLTVWTSTFSPKTGDVLYLIAGFRPILSGAPLSQDTVISFALTNSSGKSIELNRCDAPAPRGPLLSFGCAAYWPTNAPINGVSPAPGRYHISVTESESNKDNTIPNTNMGFDVTLSGG
jgi:hypothetical protein